MFLNQVQRKKAVAFLVSDFLDKGFEPSLRVAARRHDCIAITMSDPREQQFADAGLIELQDPETGETVLVDSSSRTFRDFYRREAETRRENIRALLRRNSVDQIPVSTDVDYVDPLVRFFRRRERLIGS
jgi:uncharacterized protein (DUF58 family)